MKQSRNRVGELSKQFKERINVSTRDMKKHMICHSCLADFLMEDALYKMGDSTWKCPQCEAAPGEVGKLHEHSLLEMNEIIAQRMRLTKVKKTRKGPCLVKMPEPKPEFRDPFIIADPCPTCGHSDGVLSPDTGVSWLGSLHDPVQYTLRQLNSRCVCLKCFHVCHRDYLGVENATGRVVCVADCGGTLLDIIDHTTTVEVAKRIAKHIDDPLDNVKLPLLSRRGWRPKEKLRDDILAIYGGWESIRLWLRRIEYLLKKYDPDGAYHFNLP